MHYSLIYANYLLYSYHIFRCYDLIIFRQLTPNTVYRNKIYHDKRTYVLVSIVRCHKIYIYIYIYMHFILRLFKTQNKNKN